MSEGNIRKTEVVLHVGIHKTGTTSIQQTLFNKRNNKELEKKDYHYPESWPFNHSVPVYSAFCDYPEKYHINIKNRYSKQELKDVNNNYLESLKGEVAEKKISRLIISGEDISVLSHKNLIDFKRYLMSVFSNEVYFKVIIYVRNPITWAISGVQETIKSGKGYQESIGEIGNGLKYLFRGRIEKFIQVFGSESINIYSFEDAISNEFGIVGHFLTSLGFENGEISKFEIVKSNQSTSLIAGELISFINEKFPLIKDGVLNDNRSFDDIIPLLGIRGPKFDIPYREKREIMEICQDDIKWLEANCGVNYLNIKEPERDQINIDFTEELIFDIKKAYLQLTLPLRDFVVQYLQWKLSTSLNADSKRLLKVFIDELCNSTNDNKNRHGGGGNRLRKVLGIKDSNKSVELFREIAKFLMDRALELRPNGSFIRQKCEEYKKKPKK